MPVSAWRPSVYDQTADALARPTRAGGDHGFEAGERASVTAAEKQGGAEPADEREREAERSDGPGDPGAVADRVHLGASIRRLRKRLGITQEGLAERLGVHTTFVGRLERGERGAHWRTVRRVLRALDLSPADFAATIEEVEREQDGDRDGHRH
jgi:DNA-binding XRE family transcriptional regulator